MSTHDELMQLRIQRTRKLGERPMSIKEMEAALEATRQEDFRTAIYGRQEHTVDRPNTVRQGAGARASRYQRTSNTARLTYRV